MARIETDPNYTSPTFSRATAATDIFKKEDVQALAAAMSTHVHDGAGKGLAIAPPAGSITSAMIADGTIQTPDLGDGQVTLAKLAGGIGQWAAGNADGSVYTRVNVINAASAIPGMTTLSYTVPVGGSTQVLIWAMVYMGHSVSGAALNIYYSLNGGSFNWFGAVNQQTAGQLMQVVGLGLANLGVGANNLVLGWDTGTNGTLTRGSWMSYFLVLGINK